MNSYKKVNVETIVDDCDQIIPVAVKCSQNKSYKVKRILHICIPEDKIIRYTILIGNSTRYLIFNGYEWRLTTPNERVNNIR